MSVKVFHSQYADRPGRWGTCLEGVCGSERCSRRYAGPSRWGAPGQVVIPALIQTGGVFLRTRLGLALFR